jgi:integrase
MPLQSHQIKITKRSVDTLASPGPDRFVVWDTELKGFGLRLTEGGRKTYVVKYRVDGRQRWFTIGQHGSPWTAEQARAKAAEVLRAAADGRDLQTEKLGRRDDLSVADLIDAYLREGPAAKPWKRESSWTIDGSNLNRHVRPLIGKLTARRVDSTDIARMVSGIVAGRTAADIKTGPRGRAIIKGGAAAAERALCSAAAMFTWAKAQGLVDDIPSKGIRLPRRPAKERFLTKAEAVRLQEVIRELEDTRRIPSKHADAVRLLLLTGARKSEILQLRWSEVDLERRRLTLPPERTKSGGKTGERRIALSEAAVAILAGTPRMSEVVFPSSIDLTKAAIGLPKSWRKIRDAAGMPDLRLHDLRHSFASFALANGASLSLIGKALGHSTLRVTERYAHLGEDPLDQLAQDVAFKIS